MQCKYHVSKSPNESYTMVLKAENFTLINDDQKEIYSINPYNTFTVEDSILHIQHPIYQLSLQCDDESSAAHLLHILTTHQKAIATRIQKYTYILQNGCHFMFLCNGERSKRIIWIDEATRTLNIGASKIKKDTIQLSNISFLKFSLKEEGEKYLYVIEMIINGVKAELQTIDYNKLKIAYMGIQDTLQRNCAYASHLTTVDLSFRKLCLILELYPKGIITDKMVDIFESGTSNENANDLNTIITCRQSPNKLKETTKLNLSRLSSVNPKQLLDNNPMTKRCRAKCHTSETERASHSVYY